MLYIDSMKKLNEQPSIIEIHIYLSSQTPIELQKRLVRDQIRARIVSIRYATFFDPCF